MFKIALLLISAALCASQEDNLETHPLFRVRRQPSEEVVDQDLSKIQPKTHIAEIDYPHLNSRAKIGISGFSYSKLPVHTPYKQHHTYENTKPANNGPGFFHHKYHTGVKIGINGQQYPKFSFSDPETSDSALLPNDEDARIGTPPKFIEGNESESEAEVGFIPYW